MLCIPECSDHDALAARVAALEHTVSHQQTDLDRLRGEVNRLLAMHDQPITPPPAGGGTQGGG